MTYVHKPHTYLPKIQFSNFVCQRVSQICLKLTTAFSPPKQCHFVNSLSHQGQFNALYSGLYHPQLYSPLFSTLSLCPMENGTVCFYLRVCQVTDGASMGPRDVITYGLQRIYRTKLAGRHCFQP